MLDGPTTAQWGRLRRLSFVLDAATGRTADSGPAAELRRLIEEMGLLDSIQTGEELGSVCSLLRGIVAADRFTDEVRSGEVQRLCRRAFTVACTSDGWPTTLPCTAGGRLAVGLVFRSLSGEIEGRTTGGRRRCPAHRCPGWLVGVSWETGQQTHLCSEGWHHDTESGEIRIVGGGEISARFVSPRPLGVQPLPRSQWPTREHLRTRAAWSTSDRGEP